MTKHPNSTRTTTGRLLGRFVGILAWFAPILLAGELIAFLSIRYFDTVMADSAWEEVAAAPYIFLFAIAIMLTYSYLPLHVAHGGTRRSFVAAVAATVLGASLLLAGFVQLGYLLESFVYAQFGWTQALEHDHLFRHPHQIVPLMFEYTLGCIFTGTSGMLVAGTYYRLGGGWATALLVTILFAAGTVQRLLIDPWLDTGALPLATKLVLWLVLVVLFLLMTYLTVRRAPIRSRDA